MIQNEKYALLSVFDKTGIEAFAENLVSHGYIILAVSDTADIVRRAGISVTELSHFTGFPDILAGKVAALHPRVFGGVLCNPASLSYIEHMRARHITPILIVAVNLPPFAEKALSHMHPEHCLQSIDIGGSALIQAAAKNYHNVAVVTDPSTYKEVSKDLEVHHSTTSYVLRYKLAREAFAYNAAYHACIADYFCPQKIEKNILPEYIVRGGARRQLFRYGENPHQRAAWYMPVHARTGVSTSQKVQGKELGYNNVLDADAAFSLVCDFPDECAVAIIKHTNPCGVALGATAEEAYGKAIASDPKSAFGGIVACNRTIDERAAEAIVKAGVFTEVIIAPRVEKDARNVFALAPAMKNTRILATGGVPDVGKAYAHMRELSDGGILFSENDPYRNYWNDPPRVVTKKKPSPEELLDMLFALTVVKHAKSNAIVIARNKMTLGIGAGQVSRVDAAKAAGAKSWEMTRERGGIYKNACFGAVAASDAFFPFPDAISTLDYYGVGAVIQPGGSKRDTEVIRAADERGMVMCMTGIRHFRH